MKRKGSSIIFINDEDEILLLLRDDNPDIPYPGVWDVPGGHVEKNETPEQCIIREMEEEMEIHLENFNLFSVIEFSDRVEYTFWKRKNFDIDSIILHEGQCIKWFKREKIVNLELAYGFDGILNSFFQKKVISKTSGSA